MGAGVFAKGVEVVGRKKKGGEQRKQATPILVLVHLLHSIKQEPACVGLHWEEQTDSRTSLPSENMVTQPSASRLLGNPGHPAPPGGTLLPQPPAPWKTLMPMPSPPSPQLPFFNPLSQEGCVPP